MHQFQKCIRPLEGIPAGLHSNWERRRQASERWHQAREHLGALATNLGVPGTTLGAPQITVELSGKNNIIFGNTAGAPGNHCYSLLFNDFENSCIQFVFSSMYLYRDLSTHGISGLPAGGAWRQFKMRLKMTIQWTLRYTLKPWSSKFGDTLGSHDRVNLKAVMEWVWRLTWRVWSSEFERCTWRLWSREFGDTLGGSDRARLDQYLEAVDGRCAMYWDSIHHFVNLQPCEYDNVILPLRSHGELADGGRSCREVCRNLKKHSGVNMSSWECRVDTQSCMDALLSVCCTQCMLY